MSEQAWRRRYCYVLPYALQSKRVTIHALPGHGPYFPPPCLGRHDPILVLREHMEAIGAKQCRRCHHGRGGFGG